MEGRLFAVVATGIFKIRIDERPQVDAAATDGRAKGEKR